MSTEKTEKCPRSKKNSTDGALIKKSVYEKKNKKVYGAGEVLSTVDGNATKDCLIQNLLLLT
jgi:hypothetical protein